MNLYQIKGRAILQDFCGEMSYETCRRKGVCKGHKSTVKVDREIEAETKELALADLQEFLVEEYEGTGEDVCFHSWKSEPEVIWLDAPEDQLLKRAGYTTLPGLE